MYERWNRAARALLLICCATPAATAEPQPPPTATTTIRIDATRPGRPASRHLTGACIEDVNHEVYGGLYSQMIFGESFQEPPRTEPARGFTSPDGEWVVKDGEISGGGGPGPKLISATTPPFVSGGAGVDVFLPGPGGGFGGLTLRVARAGAGADNFDGYEVFVDAARKRLLVGRHRHDFRPLKEVDCDIAPDRWITLAVKLTGGTIDVSIDGKPALTVEDPTPLPAGTVGLRNWQRPARYRNLWVKAGDRRVDLPFEPPAAGGAPAAVSGMWGPITSGGAVLEASIEMDRPFAGAQSQRITFARAGAGGVGEVGVENQGLNRRGLALAAGKPYDGYVWARAQAAADLFACAESRDGARSYARTRIPIAGDDQWHRYDFQLTPDAAPAGAADAAAGRFALRLAAPGSVVLGHAFLQPGEWGRFKGLPVRRDVVDALIDQGVTALRYGGSMVNEPQYRWKKMTGPRDRRPPYHGTWYPHSSNGWGILDFVALCDAAGFLAIPDFNADETPQDMADFVEYVNGPPDSTWGRRRAADGRPAPYALRHVELGNEEKIDDGYYAKFEPLAKAIWAKDPHIILVVGDFQYERPITDPMRVDGADSKITTLAAHKKILDLARANNREVWFDVHLWTDGPGPSTSTRAFASYVDAIDRLAAGAAHRVVVFEFNSNNHEHRRGLANAAAIGQLIRDGRVPVALAANCLQPDGQNDNGWDQGLLFLNPTKVWLQSPGYVTRMVARNYQPRAIDATADGPDLGGLSVTATASEDGKRIVLQVVNVGDRPLPAQVRLNGFTPARPTARVEELAGALTDRNTADRPDRIVPRQHEWRHGMTDGAAEYEFPPRSFTVIRLE